MSIETIVPSQETCAALAAAGLKQGKSELVWIKMGSFYNDNYKWEVTIRKSVNILTHLFPQFVIDAPTASEFGDMAKIGSGAWLPSGFWAEHITLSEPLIHQTSETEARAQLVLWLAKNRPDTLGEWIEQKR